MSDGMSSHEFLKQQEFLKEFLFYLLIVGAALGLLYWFKSDKTDKSKSKFGKQPSLEGQKTAGTEPVAYLSEFDELFRKYNIDTNDPLGFSKILEAIIRDGTEFARNALEKILLSNDEITTKAEKFLNEYEKLRSTDAELNFKWGVKDPRSRGINTSNLSVWPSEFGLEEQLKSEPRKTFELIIRKKLYQFGINSMLKKLEVERDFIKENLNKNNVERLKELMEDALQKIKSN